MSITKIAAFKGQKTPPLSVPFYDFEIVDDNRAFIDTQADSIFSTGAGLYVENIGVTQTGGTTIYTNKILRVNLYRAFQMATYPNARQFFMCFDYASNRSNSTQSSLFRCLDQSTTISSSSTKGNVHVELEFDFDKKSLRYRVGNTARTMPLDWNLVDENFSIDFFVPSNNQSTTTKPGDIRATWLFTNAIFTTKTSDATPFSFYGLSASLEKFPVTNVILGLPSNPINLSDAPTIANSTVTGTSPAVLSFNSTTSSTYVEFAVSNPIAKGVKVEALHVQLTYTASSNLNAGAQAFLQVVSKNTVVAESSLDLIKNGARQYQAKLLTKDVDSTGKQFTDKNTEDLTFRLRIPGITSGQCELFQIQFFYLKAERILKPTTVQLFPNLVAAYTPLRLGIEMTASDAEVLEDDSRNTAVTFTAAPMSAYRGTAQAIYDRIPLEAALPIRTYDLNATSDITTTDVLSAVSALNGTYLDPADFAIENIVQGTSAYELKPTEGNKNWDPSQPVMVGDLQIPITDLLRLTYLPGFTADTLSSRLIGLLPFSGTNNPGEITDFVGGVVRQSEPSNLVDDGRFGDKALKIASPEGFVEVTPTRVTNTLWTRMSTECFIYFTGNVTDLNGVIWASDTGAEFFFENGRLRYVDSDYSPTDALDVSLAELLIPNQWNHIGLIYSSLTWRYLVNGKNYRLSTPKTLYDPYWNGGSAYRIGNSYPYSRMGSDRAFTGKMSEFRWCHGETYYVVPSSGSAVVTDYVVPTAPFEI